MMVCNGKAFQSALSAMDWPNDLATQHGPIQRVSRFDFLSCWLSPQDRILFYDMI